VNPAERREPLAPDAEALAVIQAALEIVNRAAPAPGANPNPWRFSGRWWSSRPALRRERS
jgi:hypothetical protein